MQKSLKDIADIQGGFSFRGSIPVTENGNYQVIQIKDVSSNGSVSNNNLIKTGIEFIKPEYLTKDGDVLFTNRGANLRAAIVNRESANAIFVSQLYALKIKTDAVTPAFLAWYINQKPAQEFLAASASGSYIQNIRQDVLGNLPLTIPTLEIQQKIIEIHRLGLREKELTSEISAKRQQIIERTLLTLIEHK